jgi:hypothetical protein
VERYYRDSRVNRIFEGTNEINRLLIPGMLLKRAAKGHLPLYAKARAVADEILSASMQAEAAGPLGPERAAAAQAKKALLFAAGVAIQKYGDAIRDEQEVLMHLSDIVMESFAMDTAVTRLGKKGSTDIHTDIARTFINDAIYGSDTAAHRGFPGGFQRLHAVTAVFDRPEIRKQLVRLGI